MVEGVGNWSGPLEEEPVLLTTLAPYNCPFFFFLMALCLAFIDELQNNDFSISGLCFLSLTVGSLSKQELSIFILLLL